MDTEHIHDFTLTARSLLVKEAAALLDAVFGIDSDGRFASAAKLPVLEELPEAAETYRRLKQHFDDEKEAGLSPSEAVSKLFKEVAFTHLNRLVALKMLEARKLVRGTIDRQHESNAFKFYLVENPTEEEDYKRGLMPQNGIGEGPRDSVYRRFLLDQYRRLSEEIRVLFDADNLASRLFPRPRVLKQVIEALNSEKLRDAWQPGSEETIGWVYQFFNEQEKKDAFKRVFQEKKKFQREDIPAATQIFTPRWIVKFLVQNSLGRLWISMHPDSALAEKLDYLVPLAGDIPKPELKPAAEIRLLDPASGTMHFGMVAFDVLVEMYREEIARAGQDGWPATASVAIEAEIPSAIVANNLFGIDIDLRAVQLSALALYLKAKHFNKKAVFRESNLACADVLPLFGEHLNEFISSMKFSNPVYERVISALWQRLEPASYMGSLVRVDEALREIVKEERKKLRKEPEGKMVLPGFETILKSEDEFWGVLETQIIQTLEEFGREQVMKGRDESYFAGEAKKGMRVVDLLTRTYDVVLTNPPYMYNRNMSTPMSDFLKREYKQSKADLYAAFIERCSGLLTSGGRVAMITQQSFMFISSYEKMRNGLLDSSAIETMAHTGPRAFEEVTGEKVNTTAFILRREDDDVERQSSVGVYFRLVKEPDAQAKRAAFEESLLNRSCGVSDSRTFEYCQRDFGAIPCGPWVYWITPTLRGLFGTFPRLEDVCEPRIGLQTSDNPRFLRFWWEVGQPRIGFGFPDRTAAASSPLKWFPFMKGGGFKRWYGNQDYVVNWGSDGAEMKEFAKILKTRQASPPGNGPLRDFAYYFRPGVTWSRTTSKGISMRFMPRGFIFDCEAPSLFPADINALLGLLNSSVSTSLLHLINATIHFQVGDLDRLPVPLESTQKIAESARRAICLAKADSEQSDLSFDFICPPQPATGQSARTSRRQELSDIEAAIDDEVYRLYGVSDDDRQAIVRDLALGSENLEDDESGESAEVDDAADLMPSEFDARAIAVCWVNYAVGTALGRFRLGVAGALGRGSFPEAVIRKLESLTDSDGIMVLDAGHPDDLAGRVIDILAVAVGESEATQILRSAIGINNTSVDAVREWLGREFFKEHPKAYRKRPVYWFLESPKKSWGLYLFHEKATKDTLPLIRGAKYLGGRINRAKDEIGQLADRERSASGANKSKYRRQREEIEELLEDLEAFDKNLAAAMSVEIEDAKGKRTTVGWAPEIDDGVLINMAPIWFLFPSWKDEPKKCWEKLKKGDYDWSHTAMRYWPKRVLEACRKDKSYAIAHDV